MKVNLSANMGDLREFEFREVDVAADLLLELMRYYFDLILVVRALDCFQCIDHQFEIALLGEKDIAFLLLIC
jgi:hypothetical protein